MDFAADSYAKQNLNINLGNLFSGNNTFGCSAPQSLFQKKKEAGRGAAASQLSGVNKEGE
jgi:hypothetical protein